MNKKRRVIYYLADGAHIDIIKKLIDSNELPNIKKITEEGTFRKATTCFPSTTGPAYLPFLTGHFPGTMNIPGIRWFDKKEFKRKRWFNKNAMRSYCGPEAKFFNGDMPPDKPTLLEAFDKSYNLYNMITRGVEKENDLGRNGKALLYMRAHFFKRNHPVDIKGHERIMELLQSGKDFDFLFAVFPSVDWDSHYYHIEDNKTIAAYKIVDESIGEVRAFLEKRDMWHDTLFIMSSDHGLTPTHTHLDLGDWMTQHRLKPVSYPVIWRLNPKCAVSVSGNSFAGIHLLKHPGDHFLRENELLHYFGSERHDALLHEPAVDFITYRGKKENSFVVENGLGRSIVVKNKNHYSYIPGSADVFELGELMHLDARSSLEATIDSTYPDALLQIEQIFRSSRAGDFIVSAQKGYDLRDFWEIPGHKGSHGSLHREHMLVPLVCNQKLNAPFPARTADIFSTILHWMDKGNHLSEGQSLIN